MSNVPGVLIMVDSSKYCAITVQYQGKIYKFNVCQDGLYYYDTATENSMSGATYKPHAPLTPYSFLSSA